MRIKKTFLTLVSIFLLATPLWAEGPRTEVYEILQHGFIKVAGQTNLFGFQGNAAPQEGRLIEVDSGYTGRMLLRFSDLRFDLPLVDSVLERPDYVDSKVYPTILIMLDHFHPKDLPTKIKAEIELHGQRRPVDIATQFQYIPPVVKVTGNFAFNLSAFGVKPYRQGMMNINDKLEVEFKVFFCETYTDDKHQISQEVVDRLLAEDQVQVVNQKGFFGCAEIKDKKVN
ncbi:MAG: hypothetical protein A2527_05580 [Candidatus Lambdaproteobacteria bacterium RIFOXYD2_FULL_50_16]|uniref:Lipid/polyisoprenoid-binding YceI-like domain-containing protein n=1 Tax=Candidatus Lambdaproteobacteria bacterium RIFOXYD2_FULL_50_16 TaxID=1817772 RepID=A0A1F6G971_9PROT|nr:MAG: hypothetical protein A2527_05580 [Candidatus Lambdaproteobacteria bacterium RIFOXYD2_FULL_50_16]